MCWLLGRGEEGGGVEKEEEQRSPRNYRGLILARRT